ncbi:hypothetical protein RCIA84 [Methanocella arvoryzae MRE50]|uniref:Uncharacterized protein n=1 Tax=Methanocella arvoryzae (strain DSM 22066 / NBRC 105507 / MRE50) TaxID=351160 RepID=Q0W525_METAR|nr:hypothetical protein RCIA84 [Methanocella arvoryzae MRE50]
MILNDFYLCASARLFGKQIWKSRPHRKSISISSSGVKPVWTDTVLIMPRRSPGSSSYTLEPRYGPTYTEKSYGCLAVSRNCSRSIAANFKPLTTGSLGIICHCRIDVQHNSDGVCRRYVKIALDSFPDVLHERVPALTLCKYAQLFVAGA